MRSLSWLRNHPRSLLFALTALLGHVLLTLSLVPLARQLEQVLHPEHLNSLLRTLGLILAIYALKGLLMWVQTLIWSDLALRATLQRRAALYTTLLQQPLWRWNHWREGDLSARLTEDLQQVETALSAQLAQLIPNLLLLLALLVGLVWLNPLLSLLSLGLLPLGSRLLILTGHPLNRWSREYLQQRGQLHQELRETLSVMPDIQPLKVAPWFVQRLDHLQTQLRRARLYQLGWQAAQGPLLSVAQVGAISLIVVTGLWQIREQAVQAGDLLAFATALALSIDPGLALAQAWGALRAAEAAEERLQELEAWPRVTPTPHPPGSHPLELRHLSFGWPHQPALLTHLSLTLAVGEYVALTGPSGCGKSTLMALLAGQLEAPPATIQSTGTLRLIPQKTHFLNSSLRENICLGREVTPSALDKILKICQLEAVIARLPEGLHSPMGNQGSLFSGGERQRIALARALLNGAPALLLLDEATSELDLETESRLFSELRATWPEMACLQVTHRPASFKHSDRRLRLEHGKLTEWS